MTQVHRHDHLPQLSHPGRSKSLDAVQVKGNTRVTLTRDLEESEIRDDETFWVGEVGVAGLLAGRDPFQVGKVLGSSSNQG